MKNKSILFVFLILICGCGSEEINVAGNSNMDKNASNSNVKGNQKVDARLDEFSKQLPKESIQLDVVDMETEWTYQINKRIENKICFLEVNILDVTESKNGYTIFAVPMGSIGREILYKLEMSNVSGIKMPKRDIVNFHCIAFNNAKVSGFGYVHSSQEIIHGDEKQGDKITLPVSSGICFYGDVVKISSD